MSAQSWAEFLRQRRGEIRSLARGMVRRWKVPAAIEQADLEQELLLGAWQGWHAFEEGRGDMRRDLFALYRARQQVQRWVNEQRNAPRRDSKAPGRYPESADYADLVRLSPSVGAGQECAVSFTAAVRAALAQARYPQALERVVRSGFDENVLACPVQRAHARRAMRRIEEAT